MRIMQLRSKLRNKSFTACLALLTVLFSLLWLTVPGLAGADPFHDSNAATSLTIKIGYTTSTNPKAVYQTVKTFTDEEMTAMANVQQAYSYIDSMPAPVIDAAKGVKLSDLLAAANIDLNNVNRIYFDCTDTSTYYKWLSKDSLYGQSRYYYPNIVKSWNSLSEKPDKSGAWGSPTDNKVLVEPILAVSDHWLRFQDPVDFSAASQTTGTRFRLLTGQTEDEYAKGTITAPNSAKWVNEIDVMLNPVSVTGVSLDKTTDTIKVGDTDQLTATVAPANATNKNVTWTSDKPEIATVDSCGKVTAVSPGQATISATTEDGSFTTPCIVTVENPTVTPVLSALNLNGNPLLTYSGTPFTFDLGNLTLAGADQNGADFDLTGQTVTWAVYSGPAAVSGSTLTVTGSGTVKVTAAAGGVTSNILDLTVGSISGTTSMNIIVDGGSPITVTAEQINQLNTNGELRHYSCYKEGTLSYCTGFGAPLADILSNYTSIKNVNKVQSITVKASDNYSKQFTYDELFGTRYCYPVDGSAGQQVAAIIATKARDNMTNDPAQLDSINCLRLYMGQADNQERTTSWMIKWVNEIDIVTNENPTVTPVLTDLNLSGNPLLTYSGTPFTFDLGNLTLTGADQNGADFDLTGQTVTWAVYSGPATVSGSTLTVTGSGTVEVTAAAGGVTSNILGLTVGSAEQHAKYTIAPVDDAAYEIGSTSDGIKTMTVKTGVSGMKYFSVQVTPVVEHTGTESVVFVHVHNGVQTSINVTKTDFDNVSLAQAGFNVKSGDIVQVYIVDDLSNDKGSNPTILQ